MSIITSLGIIGDRGILPSAKDPEIPGWVEEEAYHSAANDSPYKIPEVDDEFTIGDLNPFNILKGTGKGVVNLAKGLGSLAMMGLGDVRSLAIDTAEEVIPGVRDTEQQYHMPEVAKALVFDPERSNRGGLMGVWEDSLGGLKDDWTRRYADPLKEKGIGGLASSILSDPLPALLDVAGAGTLAGKAASIGARGTYQAGKLAGSGIVDELAEIGELQKAKAMAQVKGKLSEVPRIEAEIAKLEELLSPAASYVHRVHPGRGMPRVLLGVDSKGGAVSQKVGLGGVKPVLGAPSGKIPVGFKKLSPNPFTRKLGGALSDAILTRPLERHLKDIDVQRAKMIENIEGGAYDEFSAALAKDPSPNLEKLARVSRENRALRVEGRAISEQERLAARAMQYGLERIPRDAVLKHRAKKSFDQIAGRYTTTFYGARDEYTQAFVDLIEEYGKRGVPVDTMVSWAQADTYGRKGVLLGDGTAATASFRDLVDTVATQVGKDPEFDPTILRDLGDDAIAAATAAMPDGFTFNADKMRLTVTDWNEAPSLLEKLANGFGGRVEILSSPSPEAGNFSGVIARINTPNGSFKVQALTPESTAVADSIDDWAEPMAAWQKQLDETAEELRMAESEIHWLMQAVDMDPIERQVRREAGEDIPTSGVVTGKLQKAYRRKAAAEHKKRELELELKASEALIEDHGELHMYQLMRHSGMDGGGKDIEFEAAEMIARLRVMRHNMTVGPARKRGKFQSASAIMERAYLPVKLELFAARSGKLAPLLDDLIEAMRVIPAGPNKYTRNHELMAKHVEQLKTLGFDGGKYKAQTHGGNFVGPTMSVDEAIVRQALDAIRGQGPSGTHFGRYFERLSKVVQEGQRAGRDLDEATKFFRMLGYKNVDDPKALLSEVLDDSIKNSRATDTNDFALGDLEAIGEVTMWEYFHDLYRAAGKQTPIYFPHIDGRRLKPSQWLMQKYNIGWEQKADQTWNKRALGHNYKNGQLVTDPVESYSRRAAQVRKYMDMLDMHNELVETFGRPVSFLDEITDGEALMAPKLTEHYFRARAQAEEEMVRLLQQGKDEGTALYEGTIAAIQKLENVPRRHMPIEDFIRTVDPDGNLARTAEDGTPLFYAVPKVVAQRLDDMAKFHLGWKARIFWDGPLNLWRGAVLAFSPRWLIYNLLGNTMFTTMQGANVVNAFKLMGQKGGRAVARKMGIDDWTPEFLRRVESAIADLGEETQQAITGGFFSSTEQNVRHLGMAENTAWGQLIKGLRAEKPVKAGAKFATRMRKLNESIEESFRQTSFIKAMDRQMADLGDGGKFLDTMDKARVKAVGRQFLTSEQKLIKMAADGVPDQAAIRGAIDEVNRFLNDYMTMSPVERNVIKRYIMPFYSFYKHQAKLISTYAMDYPPAAHLLRNAGLVSQELAQDFGNMPQWMLGMLPVGWGNNGEQRFYNTRSANPFNAMLEGPQGLLSGLAPQIRGVVESATGKDIVTGKPHTSPETVTPFGSQTAYQQDPESGEMVPTRAHINPLELVAQQFPQFELGRDVATGISSGVQGEGFQTGARYSTGEVITDPYGNPVFPGSVWQKIGQYLGYSTSDFDQEAFLTREQEMERAALIGLLRRQGILPMPVADE